MGKIVKSVRTRGFDLVVDDGSHFNKGIKTSLEHLWPVTVPGGYYVIEDMGGPAFAYLDCEPIYAYDQVQNTTALAKVAELARPLVLGPWLKIGSNATEVSRVDCML